MGSGSALLVRISFTSNLTTGTEPATFVPTEVGFYLWEF